MSNIVPKEQLSAYQRWEMDAFDETHAAFPTAEGVEQIQQQAHQEGYQEGLQQGREQGYREGGAQALQEAQRLNQLLVKAN